jgi:hypothetical protein
MPPRIYRSVSSLPGVRLSALFQSIAPSRGRTSLQS